MRVRSLLGRSLPVVALGLALALGACSDSKSTFDDRATFHVGCAL